MKQTGKLKRTFRRNTQIGYVGFTTKYITCMKCEDRGCPACQCSECGAGKVKCDRNREAHGVHLNAIGGE